MSTMPRRRLEVRLRLGRSLRRGSLPLVSTILVLVSALLCPVAAGYGDRFAAALFAAVGALGIGGIVAWLGRPFILWARAPHLVVVDETGITIEHSLGLRRFCPWDDITGAHEARSGVVIATRGGPILLPPEIDRGPAVAQAVRDRLAAGQVAEQADLSEEEIAAWLGVGPGEALLCRAGAALERKRRRCKAAPVVSWLTTATCLAALVAIYGRSWETENPIVLPAYLLVDLLPLSALCGLASLLLLPTWLARLAGDEVEATAEGLAWRRGDQRHRATWAEVSRIDSGGRHDRIRTARGTIEVNRRFEGALELLDAVERVLALRAAGHRLPRLADVPDGALSQAGRQAPDAERGLSVARSEPRP